ncbi:MAG: IMP cyclohydrolase [Oscillospiraceae bacterium]|nr:IMP cyclohydrolase [Oscillospiraceae bacterium]
MNINTVSDLLSGNAYPGRGILIGLTPDGKKAVAAYFIMGRSPNSRNRIFAEENGTLRTQPYDASKVQDPSLIIYTAIRSHGRNLIVTNGDQTDTVFEGLEQGVSFDAALAQRCFEPDGPNWTPRISGLLTFDNGFSYKMSILKAGDAAGTVCSRYGFHYEPLPGLGHLIHTYECDGNPLPAFRGEPRPVAVGDDIDAFTAELWQALNEENKISLYVRYTDITTGEASSRLVNKYT